MALVLPALDLVPPDGHAHLKNLKKNDEIVTSAGIHGTVVLVKDKTAVVRVDDNVKIEFDKEAIAHVVSAKS